jgi:hypothetical protein
MLLKQFDLKIKLIFKIDSVINFYFVKIQDSLWKQQKHFFEYLVTYSMILMDQTCPYSIGFLKPLIFLISILKSSSFTCASHFQLTSFSSSTA